jgi:type II secretory pathway pseudopilin PulG
MKNIRGMTLLETIIVFALMGIMLFCLYNTFLPGIKVWQRSDIKTQAQQSALISIQRISKELRASDIKSVVIIKGTAGTTEPDAISYLSPFGPDDRPLYDVATASVQWNKHGVFYINPATHTLHLQEQFFSAPTDSPPSYQLSAFTVHPDKDRVIARNIQSFTCSAELDPDEENKALKNPLSIKVTSKLQDYTSTIETAVSPIHHQE